MSEAQSTSIASNPSCVSYFYFSRPISETQATNNSKNSSGANSKSDSGKKGKGSAKQSKRKAADELWSEGNPPERLNPLDAFLVGKLPKFMNIEDPSLEVLCLLRALHALNRYWGSLYPTTYYRPIINPHEFINSKLTAKVNRQLQDPIIIMTSNLPTWLKVIKKRERHYLSRVNCYFVSVFSSNRRWQQFAHSCSPSKPASSCST